MENGAVWLRTAALDRVNDGVPRPTIPSPQDSIRFETGATAWREDDGDVPSSEISGVSQEVTPRRTA
jgi:hypothetical protein